MISDAQLQLLAAAGALAPVQIDAATKLPVAGTPAKATIGYSRCVNADGSVTISAFCFDGSHIDVEVPAP